MHIQRLVVILLAVLGSACASAPPPPPEPYVFGWPFVAPSELEPRGGTTRGTAVSLVSEPTPGWQRLQAADGASRDRAAILALAGDYRSAFDFLETVLYELGEPPARPYRSWGTETVAVLEERPGLVSLQHTLVMFVIDEQGERQGPFVQKHWRQDWRYEPEERLVYLGDGRFGRRAVPASERRGAWLQTVYQVDDSPRYSALGRWRHDPQQSVWASDRSWRPLPRREHSVRDDYALLDGRHRLTLLPTGWVHEQDNEKRTLTASGAAGGSRAREIGLSRYEAVRGFDFTAADRYWAATGGFWAAVREAWSRREAAGDFRLARACDGEPGFVASFRVAARLEAGEELTEEALRREAERVVACLAEPARRRSPPGDSASPSGRY